MDPALREADPPPFLIGRIEGAKGTPPFRPEKANEGRYQWPLPHDADQCRAGPPALRVGGCPYSLPMAPVASFLGFGDVLGAPKPDRGTEGAAGRGGGQEADPDRGRGGSQEGGIRGRGGGPLAAEAAATAHGAAGAGAPERSFRSGLHSATERNEGRLRSLNPPFGNWRTGGGATGD